MEVQQELTLSIGTQMRKFALVGQNNNSDYLVCCCRATCRGLVTCSVQATQQRWSFGVAEAVAASATLLRHV
jgi:hypothetical protein